MIYLAILLIGVAVYAAGALTAFVIYRAAQADAHAERDRWEAAEYPATDVAPAVAPFVDELPEPDPDFPDAGRDELGGWTPPRTEVSS